MVLVSPITMSSGIEPSFALASFAQEDRDTNPSKPPSGARFVRAWEKTAHVVIVTLFFGLVCLAAFFVGRNAVDGFLLRSGMRSWDSAELGEVVYVMRDGFFCRRMSFDNDSSELVEHTIEPCPPRLGMPNQAH
jgi:hypothetical protein